MTTVTMRITSPAFTDGSTIPSKYTCDGANISPALTWHDAPSSTKSFALICDDPDAPMGTWTHWVLYNIPLTTLGLTEDVQSLPAGTMTGSNSGNQTKYSGPCPPSGVHRYFFTLYALDIVLESIEKMDSATLQHAMQNHILAKAVIMGRYSRKANLEGDK